MEDLDLDRIIDDPVYRRRVIERLNASEAAERGLPQRVPESAAAAALGRSAPSD